MKSIHLWPLLLAVLLSGGTASQAQTTNEEYLYVTLGYKEQLLKGLDDKKGYSWRQLYQYKFVADNGKLLGRKVQVGVFDFEGLYRTGEAKPCAIVAIYREMEGIPKKDGVFWCLPHPKSGQDVFGKADKHFTEEVGLEKYLLEAYALAVQRLAGVLSQW